MGAAFFEPSSASALPNLVDPQDLGTANALMGSAWGTMVAVGAALGGVVAATLGSDVAFILNGASFLVSALLILTVKRSFQARRAEHGWSARRSRAHRASRASAPRSR